MSEWALKRFWKEASIAEAQGGWQVLLDGRPVRTPAKAAQEVPTAELAQLIAAEWEAQEEVVSPDTMPFTRMANSAIDKVRVQHREVAELLAAYGDNDLLCYRAEGPDTLVKRQAQTWDPYLDWAEATYGARLILVEGVMPQPQSPEALSRLAAPVMAANAFELAALHDLISLTGSLVLGLAAARSDADAPAIWLASRLDETFQAEQWGDDEEAMEVAALKRDSFLNAHNFYNALHAK